MNNLSLQTVFNSTVLSRLSYASSAWYGFSTAMDKSRLESFIRKCKRFGYLLESAPYFNSLCCKADERLFNSVKNNNYHVLHQFLPAKVTRTYNLRPRRHDYIVPRRTWHTMDCNFILRMLAN